VLDKFRFSLMMVTALSLASVATYSLAQQSPEKNSPFLQNLIKKAKIQAQEEYQAPDSEQNKALKALSYQQYRAIRFRPDQSIWRGLYPYEVQLFHSGFLYERDININLIDYKNRTSSLPFSTDYFSYDPPADKLPAMLENDGGFAGFRVHYPLNKSDYKDELVAFLGATYFRLVGKHQKYGISARGLTVNTGMPEGEEFPYFTDFWLIEPANGKTLSVYAKMESPSITGVYKFTLQANDDAIVDVHAWLFAREDIDKLGLAPFTSMFLYGENSLAKPDDYRPEVHDSDGIVLVTGMDEQLWRPLNNPKRLRITSLADQQPKSFGMLQRDIQYGHYLDSEAEYHQRPGLWVKPFEGFANGRLELVEIPTNSETHDNIVAHWVNDKPVTQGDDLYLHYQLQTVSGNTREYSNATVIRTLQGADVLPGETRDEKSLTRRFIVDFTAPNMQINPDQLSANISATNGTIAQLRVFKSNFNKEIRATFLFTPKDAKSVNDLRLTLSHNDISISETWTYVYER